MVGKIEMGVGGAEEDKGEEVWRDWKEREKGRKRGMRDGRTGYKRGEEAEGEGVEVLEVKEKGQHAANLN